nr:hypothetical protein [uncultured Agathobaculum sp.]
MKQTHTIYSVPTSQGTQTNLGAGTFTVKREFAGECPIDVLLQQRIQQAAHSIIH